MGVLRWSKAAYESQLNHMRSMDASKDPVQELAGPGDDGDHFGPRLSFFRDDDGFEFSPSKLRDDDQEKDGHNSDFDNKQDQQTNPEKSDFSDGPDGGNDGSDRDDNGPDRGDNGSDRDDNDSDRDDNNRGDGSSRQDDGDGRGDSNGDRGQTDKQYGQGQDYSGEGQDQRPGQDSLQNYGVWKPQDGVEGHGGEHNDMQQDQHRGQQNDGQRNDGSRNQGQEFNNGDQNSINNNDDNKNNNGGEEKTKSESGSSQSQTRRPEASTTPTPLSTTAAAASTAAVSVAAQEPRPAAAAPPPLIAPAPEPPQPPPPPPPPPATTSPVSIPSASLAASDTVIALSASATDTVIALSAPAPAASSLSSSFSSASGTPQPESTEVLGPAQISPQALPATTAALSVPPASLAAQLLPPLSTFSPENPSPTLSSLSSSPTDADNSINSSSSTGNSGMPVGMIVGISVGSVSAIAVIGALIYLLLRLRHRGDRKGTLRARRMRSRTASPEPEMMDSLVNRAAPITGGLNKKRGATKAKSNSVSASPDNTAATPKTTRNKNANTGDGKGSKPVLSIFKRRTQTRNRGLDTNNDSVDEKRLSIVADVPPVINTSLAGPGNVLVITNPDSPCQPGQETPRSGRPHLAQQVDPASSVNCPYARLQNKIKQPNATSPRLCTKELNNNNRDSVSSTATCTTCNSSPTSPLFAFSSFMKTPSLGFLKFENSVNSMPWRGSGWSVWFRQEDSKGDRTSRAGPPPPETLEK